MLLGRNNSTGASVDDNDNMTLGGEPDIRLSPVDRATGKSRVLHHPFTLLRKHSTKNKMDVTKLPKGVTFLNKCESTGFVTHPHYISGWKLAGSPFRYTFTNS